MGSWVNRLSPELFWDVDVTTVDPRSHERWIVERVLERGRWEDWLLVRRELGLARLGVLLPALRVDERARNFLEYVVNHDRAS